MSLSKPDFGDEFLSPAWVEIARAICRRDRVAYSNLERAESSDHVVFFLDCGLVLKIFRPERNCFEREKKVLEFACGRLSFATPEIVGIGKIEDLDYLLFSQIRGAAITRADLLRLPRVQRIEILHELAVGLKELHQIDPVEIADDWAEFVDDRASTFIERQIDSGVNPQVIEALPGFIEEHLPTIPFAPTVFLHGDVHFGNIRFHDVSGHLSISGLFDFADSRRGFHEYDLLAVGVLMIQGERELQREFLRAYGYREEELNDELRHRLMMFTMLYETSDLRRYALRLSPEAVDFPLERLMNGIWSFV